MYETSDKAMFPLGPTRSVTDLRRAARIARENQPDPEAAAEALEAAGFDFVTARRALRAVFGYDVLAPDR